MKRAVLGSILALTALAVASEAQEPLLLRGQVLDSESRAPVYGAFVVPTLEIKVSYHKPVSGTEVIAEGWLVHAGRTIAFLEGQLLDEVGDVCARASVTALVREFRKR